MTTDRLPIAEDVAARAEHGSYCPKLCNHTCPVLEASGRNDAVPWGFHRTVSDLAHGRLDAAAAADRLVACTGCGACAADCHVDGQDPAADVRDGRAAVHAAGAALDAVGEAVAAVAAGRSPFGDGETPAGLDAAAADVQLVVGCRDDQAVVTAAVRLLGAAGHSAAVVVPDGCCGAVLRDLGATEAADAAAAALDGSLAPDVPIVLLDPHCRSSLPAGTEARDLLGVLADAVGDGALSLVHESGVVRWHEPCLLVDGPSAGAGPAVLAATGALVELPGEAHRGCSGAGMGLELLDEPLADQVAAHRRRELAGPGPLLSGCAGAVARLGADGSAVEHVVTWLADLLDDDPESVA